MKSLKQQLKAAGYCVCDPTCGESCPTCDGIAADERALAADLRRRMRALPTLAQLRAERVPLKYRPLPADEQDGAA